MTHEWASRMLGNISGFQLSSNVSKRLHTSSHEKISESLSQTYLAFNRIDVTDLILTRDTLLLDQSIPQVSCPFGQ